MNETSHLLGKARSPAPEDGDLHSLLFAAEGRLDRSLAKSSSVILADSGKKVYRTNSFFNQEFESLNDDTIQDSEYSESLISVPLRSQSRVLARVGSWRHKVAKLLRSDRFHSVLKCAVAYLIASLGVYYTPFSRYLGNTDSKHVAATASVYFHPARTKGAMHQSVLFVMLSLAFTFALSFSCRAVSSHFFNIGQDEVSYTIDLLVSSFGLGTIAYMKQKVNKDTFNTACSLASISLVTCIVKEGSLNSNTIPMGRLLSTSKVVLVGSLVSVVVCYALWPKSAVTLLRTSLNDSFNVMSSLVSVVTHRFINGEKLSAKEAEIFTVLRKKVADLTRNLDEAKFELYFTGKESEYNSYCDIVHATSSLSEHLHALRSSCEMQWQLHQQNTGNNQANDDDSARSLSSDHSIILPLSQSVENMANVSYSHSSHQANDLDYSAVYATQLFDLFVYYLSPSIKSFVFTVKEVLGAVPFENKILSDNNQSFFVKSTNYQLSLQKAIELFQDKQVKSFDKLYSQDIFKSSNFNFRTDQEEVTACCGNFSSLLALYGQQLVKFLQLSEQFEVVSTTFPRSWKWTRFWNRSRSSRSPTKNGTFIDALRDLKTKLNPSNESTNPEKWERLRFQMWKSLSFMRRTDIQFGIRVGVGAFCISIFAFLPQTKSFFVQYRLEWTLAIYCIMMNKSLGGTNMTAKWRFTGTFLGAFLAYISWKVWDGNVFVLAITGFFLSLPCFYIIIFWKKNNAYGRFILLTYNLTALYSYSMAQNDSEDGNEGGDLPIVGEIAFHRFLAVSVGIVWALFVANFFLPNSARVRLKSGLTLLWLRMGIIWNSDPMDYKVSPTGTKLLGLKDYEGTRALLLECQTLVKQAPVEFRLKGRFPREIYEKLLKSTSLILDAFSNLQLMIEVDPDLVPNEEYVLKAIESERDELEHRIFLIFYTISSALALGFPLPTKPASTEHAKDRMLLKLSEFRSSSSHKVHLTNEDYVLLYSYILVTSTITRELDRIIANIKDLLGNLTEDIFSLV